MAGRPNYELLNERVKLARAAIDEGKKIHEFARDIGRFTGGIHHYFIKNGYRDIVEAFKHNPRGNTIHGERLLERLQVIAEEESKGFGFKARAAKRLGISPQRVASWLKEVAPDGVQDALMDYTE
jgi:hypothetical protein